MDYLWLKLKSELADQVRQHLGVESVVVEDANPKSGADLAIPVFAFAKQLQKSPQDIATQLSGLLAHENIEKIEPVHGYVNVWLKIEVTAPGIIEQAKQSGYGRNQSLSGQEIVIEHTDPNPFKQMHIGHLYSNTIGEAISRLHEAGGAKVHRVSYHGDVGPHIAKSMFGIRQLLDKGTSMQEIPENQRVEFLGNAYALGAKAYKEDETAQQQIDELNQQIYEQSDDIREMYEQGKQWSFDYFDAVYERVGTLFEKRYLESETAERGLQLVREHTGKVYEQSDGAIIFRGEDHGLHTRVFITKDGLPLYETKDLGLVYAKRDDYPNASKSIVITAREQADYFAVMLKSLEQFAPELAEKTMHIAHGEVRLPSGKMSSRTGDVITAEQLFSSVTDAVKERSPESPSHEKNMLAAIKYAFLKQNIGANIIFDIEESVSLEGQTGPYIQYAAVRINSILEMVETTPANWSNYDWRSERDLLLHLVRYPAVVHEAISELAPHSIAQYLYQLARSFNRYYEQTSLKATEDDGLRGARRDLLVAVRNTLSEGLDLLNIPVPQKM